MRTAIVYRENSDHARAVADFLRDFARQTGKQIEAIDPDSRDGGAFCQTYDIVEYPSVLAIDHSGALHQLWRGVPLPTIGEVSYYVRED